MEAICFYLFIFDMATYNAQPIGMSFTVSFLYNVDFTLQT